LSPVLVGRRLRRGRHFRARAGGGECQLPLTDLVTEATGGAIRRSWLPAEREQREGHMSMKCIHRFEGGLCMRCLAPETEDDTQRAVNAVENAFALEDKYSDVLGRYLTREDAIFEAWRSHRKERREEEDDNDG